MKLSRTGLKTIIFTALCLIFIYVAMISILPKSSIWEQASDNGFDRYVQVETGKEYSISFQIQYDSITEISVDLQDKDSEEPVHAVDAIMTLSDCNGEVLLSKNIHSVYEDKLVVNSKKVDPGEVYDLSLQFRGEQADYDDISIAVNKDGRLFFSVSGLYDGTSNLIPFSIIYAVASLMLLMYLYRFTNDDKQNSISIDRFIWLMAALLALTAINQQYDLVMIGKGALRLIDAIKDGKFFGFYDYAYGRELELSSEVSSFSYNYSVLIYLPIAVLLLPFSFFTDGDLEWGVIAQNMVLYLDFIVLVATWCSIGLIGKLSRACNMPEEYTRITQYIYAFSPALLYVTVAFGQIDIFYVMIILCALIFYYKGNYYKFSMLMALAVAFKLLPLMIFFPLLLLSCKKITHILSNTLICLSVTVFSKLVWERGEGYDIIMDMIEKEYSFEDRLFEVSLSNRIALFFVIYAIICLICYMINVDTADRKKLLYDSMLIIFCVYGIFVILVDFHIQWIIPMLFALAFLLPFRTKDNRLLIVNFFFEALLMIILSIKNDIISLVDFGYFYEPDYIYRGPFLGAIIEHLDENAVSVLYSFMFALVSFLMVFLFHNRKKISAGSRTDFKSGSEQMILAESRVFIFYFMIAFSVWCYSFIG